MSYYKHGRHRNLSKLENYELQDLPTPCSLDEEDEILLETLRNLYVEEDKTVREIAEYYQIPYTSYLQKLFFWVFPKGKGKGGKRKGSGQKKKNK